VKTYETFEETEEIEEVIDETEISTQIVREEKVTEEGKKVDVATSVTNEDVSIEEINTKVVVIEDKKEEIKESVAVKETSALSEPAVSKGSSWFRRLATGAGAAAAGALTHVDGVWKRTVQVLTTRKAKVDQVIPFHKHAYVYYDDEVYDATLTQKTTGVTYITQLIYNSEEHVYYVYIRSGETDYKLDGPHKTVEEAKTAFQVTYRDNF
ncbi:hypothetical protein BGZ83_005110, partial [Gryganskiella cystojenkinii]